jgi:prevent-host-death family protein
MEQVSSDGARRNFAAILEDVLRGEHIGISRYGRPLAVLVPAGWHQAVGNLARFPLDMAQIACPDCGSDAYPSDMGDALRWALTHECKALMEASGRGA